MWVETTVRDVKVGERVHEAINSVDALDGVVIEAWDNTRGRAVIRWKNNVGEADVVEGFHDAIVMVWREKVN